MARKTRIHVPGGVYHVMLRGNGGQDIFFNNEDRFHLYLLLQEGIARYGYRVHGFCLMKNHMHFALQVGQIPLSKILQNLSFRYTRWVNRRKKRMGHLFQGRYKALLVDADNYLLELVRYIHLNPLRAKIVKKPEEYAWSGHRAYMGKQKLLWLSAQWVLGQFAKDISVARRRYAEFIRDGYEEGYRKEFHQGEQDVRVLGDDDFIEQAIGEGQKEKRKKISLEEIIRGVCKGYGIKERELKSVSRDRRGAEGRSVIGYLVMETGCATLTQVGKRFGRDVATLSKGVRRVMERIGGSGKERSKLMKLIGEKK